ncbi:MAG TPA: nucleotidyltransferase domain-containing protein [Candidatus Nanoarchaeia archaeon]|nr:nucleotidyltransferase domain-containing protein [Candidatus Nanoarchaeia archaeon]
MLQNYNKWKVLGLFFDDPLPEGGGFQLREISRKVKIAPTSVKNYLKELETEGLILKSKHRVHGFPLYFAGRENEKFIFYKRLNTLSLVFESGLLNHLQETCMPEVIVLFGSAAKGEDIKTSDIDLFIQCKERKIELEKFEKKINRRISLFFAEDFSDLSGELRNNLINGIKLKGYLKVF